jgi:uroporphyrinogen decarboxylase
MTMTPRERWQAVLSHRKPDRIPTDYWGTSEITTKLLHHFGLESTTQLWKTLHIDKVHHVNPVYVGPEPAPGEDMWGIRRRIVRHADGAGTYSEPENHPWAGFDTIDELEATVRWPSADWWDYTTIPDAVEAVGDYPRQGGGSEPFLTYCHLRGMEQAYMDLALNPELAHHCIGKLYDLAYERTNRILEAADGQIDFIYVAEDMGSQSSLLFSPSQIEEFFVPGFKRMIELGHSAGAKVFHHSDGSVRPIIPRMIDLGIDILNPIQWRCAGIDREELKSSFGDRIVFHGAMDNQETLPFATPEEVVDEVRDNIRVLGADGGYVLAPCHNLQSITPVENVIAMYETAWAEGGY